MLTKVLKISLTAAVAVLFTFIAAADVIQLEGIDTAKQVFVNVNSSSAPYRLDGANRIETPVKFPQEKGEIILKASFEPVPLAAGAERRINHILSFSGRNRTNAEFAINQYPGKKELFFAFSIRQNNNKFVTVSSFCDIVPGKVYNIVCAWNSGELTLSVDGKVLKSVKRLPFANDTYHLSIGKTLSRPYSMPLLLEKLVVRGDAPVKEESVLPEVVTFEPENGKIFEQSTTFTRTKIQFPGQEGYMELDFTPDFVPVAENEQRRSNALVTVSGTNRTVAELTINQYRKLPKKLINYTIFTRDGKYAAVQGYYNFQSGEDYKVVVRWDSKKLSLSVNNEIIAATELKAKFIPAHRIDIGKVSPRRLSLPMKVKRFILRGTAETKQTSKVYSGMTANWAVNSSKLKLEELLGGRLRVTFVGGSYAILSVTDPVYPAPGNNHIRASGTFTVEKEEYGSMMLLRLNNTFQHPVHVMSGNRYHRPLAQFKTSDTPVDKFDFSIPSVKDTPYTFSILFYGNPRTVIIDKVNVRSEKIQPNGRPKPTPENREFDAAEVEKSLAALKPVRAEIRRGVNRCALFLDGKAVSPAIYRRGFHYPFWSRYKDFGDAGINNYIFYAHLNKASETHSCNVGNLWLGKDKYDFSKLAHELRVIHAINPNARVLLAVCCEPYEDWAKDYPDAVFTNSKGEKGKGLTTAKVVFYGKRAYEEFEKHRNEEFFDVPSNYSAEYRDELCKAMAAVTRFIESDPAGKIVYGIHVVGGADGQFFPYDRDVSHGEDHSPAAKRAWRNYLRKKYDNDLSKLRAAWNEPAAEFDTARVPGMTERGQDNSGIQPTVCGRDYMLFVSEALTDLRLAVFKTIKDNSNRRLLAGAYYPHGAPGDMHSKKILDSPDTDFLVDIRRVTPAGSFLLRNKLYIAELDMRVPDRQTPIGNYTFDWTTFYNIVREATAVASLRESGMFYFFDLGESWYSNPDTVRFLGKVNQQLFSALDSSNGVEPVIGVFRDYTGLAGYSYRAANHLTQVFTSAKAHTLDRCGVPYQGFVAEDIFREDLKLPKIIYFPLVPDFNAEQIRAIRARAKAAKSMIVWGYYRPFHATKTSDVAGFEYSYPERKTLAQSIATGEGFTAGSAGKVMGESYTGFSWFGPFLMGYERCAAIKAEPGDTILARYSDGSGVAAVMREVDGVLEIANGAPGGFSPAFFRNAARALGAQILNERDDVVVFAESGVLSVFCDRGGDIEVNIPAGQKIVSCITGKEYEVRNGKLKFHSFDGETTWFKLAKCK